jgi:FkbM family methyltransferase
MNDVVSISGFRIRYNNKHDIAAIIENYFLNVYNVNYIRRNDYVIDLGAGIGDFALLASKKAEKVFAIEPNPKDYSTLLENIKRNNINNIIPINMAVSDKKSRLNIQFKNDLFEAKAAPLKEILNEYEIDFKKLKFMKMDIEGYEREVIPNSIDIIKSLNYLAIEIHDNYFKELKPVMEKYGFKFYRITRTHYIMNSIRRLILNPKSSLKIYKLLKNSGEYPGIYKVLNGIEISKSDELVVGIFKRFKQN